jgi:hypothetical protein
LEKHLEEKSGRFEVCSLSFSSLSPTSLSFYLSFLFLPSFSPLLLMFFIRKRIMEIWRRAGLRFVPLSLFSPSPSPPSFSFFLII